MKTKEHGDRPSSEIDPLRGPLRVLVVEDSEFDFELVLRQLRAQWPEAVAERVDTKSAFEEALSRDEWDVVIADYHLPAFSGLDAMRLWKARGAEIPLIIVSGTIGEETAVEAMKAGAHDYVMKNRLARLAPAVERELRDAESRRARMQAERELASAQAFILRLLDYIPAPVEVVTLEGRIRTVNRSWEAHTGRSRDEVMGRPLGEVLPAPVARRLMDLNTEVLRTGSLVVSEEIIPGKEGERHFEIVKFPLVDADGAVEAVGGIALDVTGRKRTEKQLQNSLQQLRALSARLQSVREEERTRISREVHDELGQALTALKMDLAWLGKRLLPPRSEESVAAAQQKLRPMADLIDGTIKKVRQISSDLRPGILDDLGLVAAIEWQVNDFQQRTGIASAFVTDVRENPLGPERSTALFRILQETLTNVARHASATAVSVSLLLAKKGLELRVTDDGAGISPGKLSDPKSLGLLGMRERALILGGSVEIRGAIGEGTTVSVRIPAGAEEIRTERERVVARKEEPEW